MSNVALNAVTCFLAVGTNARRFGLFHPTPVPLPHWVGIETAMTYLNDLDKGLNPPTTPVTMSAAQAKQDYLNNWKQRMPALKSGVWKIPATQPAK